MSKIKPEVMYRFKKDAVFPGHARVYAPKGHLFVPINITDNTFKVQYKEDRFQMFNEEIDEYLEEVMKEFNTLLQKEQHELETMGFRY